MGARQRMAPLACAGPSERARLGAVVWRACATLPDDDVLLAGVLLVLVLLALSAARGREAGALTRRGFPFCPHGRLAAARPSPAG